MTKHELEMAKLLGRLEEGQESLCKKIDEATKRNTDGHNQIIAHLATLNGSVSTNRIRSENNKTRIDIQWWVITAVLIAVALRFLGIV